MIEYFHEMFNSKPGLYYKRIFTQFRDDIIKVSDNGEKYTMLWEADTEGKWAPGNHNEYIMVQMCNPFNYIEYSSLEELMEDMFQELM